MSKLRTRGLVAASVLLATAVLSGCGPRQPWQSELVSVNAAGTDSGDAASTFGVFSADGTKVVFVSWGGGLGPADTNGQPDVYVRDLVAGTTTLVSVNAAGTDSGDGESLNGVFSPDGTKVAFASDAALVPTDRNGTTDLYVRDLATQTTMLASVNATGTSGGNRASYQSGSFSPDGTKIAFQSYASDLGPADDDTTQDVYVRDLVAGATTLVSVDAPGTGGSSGTSANPTFSPDGTKIAFDSNAGNLGPTDTNGSYDVYVRDLVAGATTLVSVNATGTDSGDDASNGGLGLVFSPDGTKVAFTSYASDLGSRDTNATRDIYVRDLVAGTTSLVSVNASGTSGGNRSSGGIHGAAFGPTGSQVAFFSYADDLGPVDTNGEPDVYLRDLATGRTTLVSVDAAGTDSAPHGTVDSEALAMSPDGTKVAFSGRASLVPVDEGTAVSVYVRDLVHETTTLVSSNARGTGEADGTSYLPASVTLSKNPGGLFSPDGRRLVFTSSGSNLGPTDHDRSSGVREDEDVYVATLRGADLSIEGEVEPNPVEPGATLTYSLDVANDGPDGAEDAAVAVLLPEGTFAADVRTSQGECGAPTGSRPLVACYLGDLPVDGTAEVTVWAHSDAPPGTALAALAAVSSEPTADPTHRNNTVPLTTTITAG